MTVLENSASNGALVVYRLRQPAVRFSVNDQEGVSQEAAIRNELDSDIFVDVDCQGRIISLRMDLGVVNSEDLSRRFARALMAATQFVLADEGTQPAAARGSWEIMESDPFGSYITHYQVIPERDDASLKTFRKTKLRYLPSAEIEETGEQEFKQTIVPKVV